MRGRTGVCAQVSGESITAAARVAAERALEGFLARVKLNVSQQVSFLGEGHTTLAALEWTITCIQGKEQDLELCEQKRFALDLKNHGDSVALMPHTKLLIY